MIDKINPRITNFSFKNNQVKAQQLNYVSEHSKIAFKAYKFDSLSISEDYSVEAISRRKKVCATVAEALESLQKLGKKHSVQFDEDKKISYPHSMVRVSAETQDGKFVTLQPFGDSVKITVKDEEYQRDADFYEATLKGDLYMNGDCVQRIENNKEISEILGYVQEVLDL